MNFYRRGQSVARIGLNRRKEPVLSVHAKYVLPKAGRNAVGREYATLTTKSLFRQGEHPPLPYEGIETLKGWIRAVNEEYGGDEKGFIDDLLNVPENDGVIDLEMGLPAWSGSRVAVRMDLVSVERVSGQLAVFFGEVKLVTDTRLRCRAALVRDKLPEVLEQLSIYRRYLADPQRRMRVGEQYSNAARVMQRIRKMANGIGLPRCLGTAISEAADENLAVAELARLIVCNDERANQRAWAEHRTKLEAESDLVPMIVLDGPAALNFKGRS
jgi:hypothetical protein